MHHVVLTWLDLALLLGAALGSLATSAKGWAWVLLLTSIAWFPLNNGVVEGAVLYSLSDRHGLTLSDLLGIGGAVVAGLRLWPPSSWRSAGFVVTRAGFVAGLVVAGLVLATFVTDDRVEERLRIQQQRREERQQRQQQQQQQQEGQRSTVDIRRSANTFPPAPAVFGERPGPRTDDVLAAVVALA